jgi:hypothetical protein
MESLSQYAEAFDHYYPNYSEGRYAQIALLVERYAEHNVLSHIQSAEFQQFSELLRPLIAIKNYKSQVPFPEDLAAVIENIIHIRRTTVGPIDVFGNHADYFNALIQQQGFQLPTVSAVFHFCHRDRFPIVDVNVEAACVLLKEQYPAEFPMSAPRLPAPSTSPANKLAKYRDFISFIQKIIELQQEHVEDVSLRYIDRALMVLGNAEFRREMAAG